MKSGWNQEKKISRPFCFIFPKRKYINFNKKRRMTIEFCRYITLKRCMPYSLKKFVKYWTSFNCHYYQSPDFIFLRNYSCFKYCYFSFTAVYLAVIAFFIANRQCMTTFNIRRLTYPIIRLSLRYYRKLWNNRIFTVGEDQANEIIARFSHKISNLDIKAVIQNLTMKRQCAPLDIY
jgi:hypothetical protein